MADPVQALLMLSGLAFVCLCCGAAFAFGACLVCRQMNWAPVNLTVNLNDHRDF